LAMRGVGERLILLIGVGLCGVTRLRPNFAEFPSETVWKIGMGPESGLRERPTGVEGVSIRALLVAPEARSDAFGFFPNSFSTHSGE